MTPAMTIDELAERLEALSLVASKSVAIVVSNPDAARYARVLEYGSIAGQQPWPHPGPRTVLAVDPETGAQVVVSAQAPQGFIRVRAPQFLDGLLREAGQPLDWLDAAAVETQLADAVRRAAQSALDELRGAAPRDSGKLAQSLAILTE